MLSLLPELYNWSGFAPLILRVAVGLAFILQGLMLVWRPRLIRLPFIRLVGLIEVVLGALLFVGLFTQVVAILIMIELVGYIFINKLKLSDKTWTNTNILLLLAMALTILFLGPGLLAFDLPL